MNKYALIVAGGSGQRMQSATPKQFMVLGDQPVLMHTIKAFQRSVDNLQIVLVIPEHHKSLWQGLVEKYDFTIPHTIIAGGVTRFQSVKNGLDNIEGTGLVAIHDGVRPLVSTEIIHNCFAMAEQKGTAITVVSPKDSIRKITGDDENLAVKRENYRLVQTPQTFNLSLIKQAYASQTDISFTDDASVAENAGHIINLVAGDYRNIKITTPEDIKMAQALLDSISTP